MQILKVLVVGLFLTTLSHAIVRTAGDFTCKDVNGKEYHLYDLLDSGKVVVIDMTNSG